MAIKAASVEPQMVKLEDLDPSGETWVWVKPRTARMDLQRAQLLKTQEWTPDGQFIRVVVNPIELQHWQIWLSCGGPNGEIGNIVVESGEGDELVTTRLFAKKRDEYSGFGEFQRELFEAPVQLVSYWTGAIYGVNGSWVFPF